MMLDLASMRPRWTRNSGEVDSGGVRGHCAAEREGNRGSQSVLLGGETEAIDASPGEEAALDVSRHGLD